MPFEIEFTAEVLAAMNSFAAKEYNRDRVIELGAPSEDQILDEFALKLDDDGGFYSLEDLMDCSE